jgi:hypothetical protein
MRSLTWILPHPPATRRLITRWLWRFAGKAAEGEADAVVASGRVEAEIAD